MGDFVGLLISIFIIFGFIFVMWAGLAKKKIKELFADIIDWLDGIDSDIKDSPLTNIGGLRKIK